MPPSGPASRIPTSTKSHGSPATAPEVVPFVPSVVVGDVGFGFPPGFQAVSAMATTATAAASPATTAATTAAVRPRLRGLAAVSGPFGPKPGGSSGSWWKTSGRSSAGPTLLHAGSLAPASSWRACSTVAGRSRGRRALDVPSAVHSAAGRRPAPRSVRRLVPQSIIRPTTPTA